MEKSVKESFSMLSSNTRSIREQKLVRSRSCTCLLLCEAVEGILDLFQTFDDNNDGTLQASELKNIMQVAALTFACAKH